MRNDSTPAFTRADLVVVMGVISLLGILTLSALAKSQVNGKALVCLNHLKTLTRAWALYAQDNGDTLVLGAAQEGDDTIPWHGGQTLDLPEEKLEGVDPNAPERSISSSPLWQYAGENPRTWRCPTDLSVGQHPDYRKGLPSPRVRSYSLNNWVGGQPRGERGESWLVYRELTDFIDPGPAETLVFVDENPDSIDDGMFGISMNGFDLSRGSNRSAVIADYPSSLHDGAGALSFVDGHCELHFWMDYRTRPWVSFTRKLQLDVRSSSNADVLWLEFHSTRRSDP